MPLLNHVQENTHLIRTTPGFLINPDQLIVYISKSHVAFEITGPSHVNAITPKKDLQVTVCDLTQTEDLLKDIVGFEYAENQKIRIPFPPYVEDLVIPSNQGFDKLLELKWNFMAQDLILTINPIRYSFSSHHFTRVVNAMFFDANDSGLQTRNIKWLDCYPAVYRDVDENTERIGMDSTMFKKVLEGDKEYLCYPKVQDYKFSKLQQLNRFIELIGNSTTTEIQITKFLDRPENQFILLMAFFAVKLHSEVECIWQSEIRTPIRPDFFVTMPNGYSNILEFKLPNIGNQAIVGSQNRERLSANVYSHISQTRGYAEYFSDPNNRNWLLKTRGIKVHFPKRIIVVGRRWNFENTKWKETMSEFRDTELVTYDDLIDVVSAHLYLE